MSSDARALRQRIADWHGAHAADAYYRFMRLLKSPKRPGNPQIELAAFVRHILIAERLWRAHG